MIEKNRCNPKARAENTVSRKKIVTSKLGLLQLKLKYKLPKIIRRNYNIQTDAKESVDYKLNIMSKSERSFFHDRMKKLKNEFRKLKEIREDMTTENLKAYLKNPIKARNHNHSSIAGGIIEAPTNIAEVRNFPVKVNKSRDEHRRRIETMVAKHLLSKERKDYQELEELMTNTEESLKGWVDRNTKVDSKKAGVESAKQLFGILYNDSNKKYTATGLNDQNNQFRNAVLQSKNESSLSTSATRCIGLIQCVAWLAQAREEKIDIDIDIKGKKQNDKTLEIYEKHKFFGQGRGRIENHDKPTPFKGIIKSEKYASIDNSYKNPAESIRAQTAHKPTYEVSPKRPKTEKEKKKEKKLPAWLTDEKSRTMPFVNSVSGVGLISSISCQLNLIPQQGNDALMFYSLAAAAQLYTVGGHSFYEFMEGVRIGQDAIHWTLPDPLKIGFDIPLNPNSINYDTFVDKIPNEVLTKVIEELKGLNNKTK